MSPDRSADASRQRFNELVATGAYGPGFTHPQPAQDFVCTVVKPLLAEFGPEPPSLRVLDAGCGTGAWLRFLHGLIVDHGGQPALYGFDVADGMVAAAEQDLTDVGSPVHVQRGDILDRGSYRFADGQCWFDIVFAYDVVQQVPPRQQFAALERLADAVKPGGQAVIFDHERWSRYGLRMAFRKFVTANLGIPLVPRYFCAASYPPLAHSARRISAPPDLTAEVVAAGHPRKRALIVRRAPETV